ncbi:MerR family transcriptional regulator, partial [Amycolatopsis rhizosphaerae]
MRFSISEVARISGVSARTLRHYDQLGLLPPAEVGRNGYRWYGRGELLRLQRILLLRRLGLGLERIGEVLRQGTGEAEALHEQLVRLRAEREHLDRVIGAVEATIADLGAARISDPERFFEGLRQEKDAMRDTLGAGFGPVAAAAFEDGQRAQEGFSAGDYEHAAAQGRALFRRLAEVMRGGVAPDAPAALDAVAEHYSAVSRY